MKYLLIIAVVFLAVWYYYSRPVEEDPAAAAAAVRPATPEQQIQSVISNGTVDASQLAALCTAYPELVSKMLRGVQIQISGTVAYVRLAGMQGRRADVVMNGASARKVVLSCDLDQYSGPGVNFRYIGNFQVVGTELIYLFKQDRTLTKRTVITQGASVRQYCSLGTMGGTFVEFKMVNGPVWAGAVTNLR